MKFWRDPVFWFYAALYALLYFTALNFNYVEGDDASTILYHLCGRDKYIQPPYAAYHSGLDFVLGFLPAEEPLLRRVAIWISFFSGFLVLYLSKVFLETLLQRSIIFFGMLLPFLIPDFLFHSLLINPTNIAYAFSLISLIFFIHYLRNKQTINLIAFIVAFALAIPFRWSILMFAPVFLGVAIFLHPELLKKTQLKVLVMLCVRTICWVSAAVFLGLVFTWLTGYAPKQFIEVFLWGKTYTEENERSLLSLFAMGSPLLTPGVILLGLMGSIFFISQKSFADFKRTGLMVFAAVSLAPYLVLGTAPALKFIVSLLPLGTLFLLFAFEAALKNPLLRFGVITVAILPWVIGLKINLEGTAYGPGFEIKNIRPSVDVTFNEKNTDQRISFSSIKLTIAGGLYMPTLEGPRPLYGYADVLFGRAWYNHIEDLFLERKAVFDKIVDHNYAVEYFQDRSTAYFQSDLYRFGFHTDMAFQKEDSISVRNFIRGQDTIKIKVIPAGPNRAGWIASYANETQHPLIFRSSYSSLVL